MRPVVWAMAAAGMPGLQHGERHHAGLVLADAGIVEQHRAQGKFQRVFARAMAAMRAGHARSRLDARAR